MRTVDSGQVRHTYTSMEVRAFCAPTHPVAGAASSSRVRGRVVGGLLVGLCVVLLAYNYIQIGSGLQFWHRHIVRHTGAHSISCRKLLEGDAWEQTRAATAKTGRFLSASSLVQQTKDCKKFKQERRYIMSGMLPEERDFPIAYSILLYRSAGMVERLLRAIYRPHNHYCLHVDAKAPNEMHLAMAALSRCFHNVQLVPDPVEVYWGYYGLLQAELSCMKLLVQYTKWRYFINLTGEEFPLKTNLEIVRILGIMEGRNEVSSSPVL